MAGISGLIGVVATSASNIQERISGALREAQRIGSSWQGEDHEAFEDAYNILNKETKDINEKYRRIDGKLRSLQSSIEAAERDKAEKRRKAMKR